MRRSDRAVEVIAPGGHLGFCVGWPAWPLSRVAAQPPWLRARVRDSVMELVGADPAAHTLWRNTRSCPRLTRTGRTRRGCSTQRVDFGGAAIGSGSLRCTRTAVLPHHRFPISLACQSPAGGVVRPGPGIVGRGFASRTSTTSHTPVVGPTSISTTTQHVATHIAGNSRDPNMLYASIRWRCSGIAMRP